MKKSLIALSLLALVTAVVFSQRATIAERILQKGLQSRLGADVVDSYDDGLHLTLCGAGGPLPGPKASGPCVAVVAGSRLFIVDAGTDGLRNLGRMGFAAGSIEAVFLTHFHSDHIDGLGELATIRWVSSANTQPLPVYGPTGVAAVVDGFNTAYAADMQYRHDHHGDTVAPLSGAGMTAESFPVPMIGTVTKLIDEGDLKIEAFAVDHAPVTAAVGYRFSYKDRSLLITGDTTQQDNIAQLAQGVDLLVHEALAPNLVNMMNKVAQEKGNRVLSHITHDILDYHTSPVEAAETARTADVGHLLYYHIVPPVVFSGQQALFLNGAEDVFPDYTVGRDGTTVSLPAGTDTINLSRKRF